MNNTKKFITNLLNIVFILYSLTFLIDSGLERLCIYIATALWILEGNFKEKFKQIFNQKVILFYFCIIFLFLISLSFFSNSIHHGFWGAKYSNGYTYIFLKNITYFVMAIYISTSAKKEFLQYILIGFVLQATYMALYSYGIYFGFLRGSKYDPTHFVHHIFFSIVMSLGFFSSLSLSLEAKNKYIKFTYLILCFIMLIDLFITRGRTGQLAFLIGLLSTLYYYMIIHKRKAQKKLIFPIVIILISLFAVFNLSTNFQNRTEQGFSNIKKVINKRDYSTSWGVRIGFDIVNIHLLFENPKNFIFGLGMGNSKETIKNYVKKTDPSKKPILRFNHVHNQFLQIWIDGGVLALFFYLFIYIYIIKIKVIFHKKLLAVAFASIFLTMSIGDIIYHRATILGLFAMFIGYLLAIEKYDNTTSKTKSSI